MRIAAGVRAKNRENFLKKLSEMNVTEEQYEQQQIDLHRKRQEEKLARRTSKGGYRLTEETKQKISQILKTKYANGEIKLREINTRQQYYNQSNYTNTTSTSTWRHHVVRSGFSHSDETKRKISESLKRLWSTNETYRSNMMNTSSYVNARDDVRQKIGSSLRTKWNTNHTFRQQMMLAFSNRSSTSGTTNYRDLGEEDPMTRLERTLSHRERISLAMKAKWQDETYRTKALAGFAARKQKTQERNEGRTVMKRNRTTSSSPSRSGNTTTNNNKFSKQSINRIVEVRSMNHRDSTRYEEDVNHQYGQPMVDETLLSSFLSENDDIDENAESLIRVVQPLTRPRKKTSPKESKNVLLSRSFGDLDNEAIIIDSKSAPASKGTTSRKGGVDNNGSSNDLHGYQGILTKHDELWDDDDILFDDDEMLLMDQYMAESTSKSGSKATKSNSKKGSVGYDYNGNVNRLQQERPDLYDLLYGFEETDDEYQNGSNGQQRMHENGRITGSYFNNNYKKSNSNNNNHNVPDTTITAKHKGGSSSSLIQLLSSTLGDENLDTFDPYGLDDF
jgi:NUMOD3 motif